MENAIGLKSLPDEMLARMLKEFAIFGDIPTHLYVVYDEEDKPFEWYYAVTSAEMIARRINGRFVLCLVTEDRSV